MTTPRPPSDPCDAAGRVAALERVVRAEDRPPFLEVRELWRYRDLLRFLVRRELRSRYRQTVLGVLWAVIQPVFTMVVFSVVLGSLARVPSEGIPYPVFAYLGILPWQYVSGVVGRSTASMVSNANLIQVVYFPRLVVPLGVAVALLADYAVAFVVLVGIMLGYGIAPAPGVLLLPLLLAYAGLVGTGIGTGLAAVNVRYRDVGHAVPFLLQTTMFLTPVVYPLGLVPEGWQWAYALNPATGIVETHRALVLGRTPDPALLAVSAAAGLVLAWLGIRKFSRTERDFADLV